MAILTGTSRSRFPPFTDSQSGVGAILKTAQDTALSFLSGLNLNTEQSFVEDGVSNIAGFSTVNNTYDHIQKPSRRKIHTQTNNATIFVKKRIFSTLRSNYDFKFMNEEERIFLKASKKLFERKTHDLAFYESLSNVENLFNDTGHLDIDSFSESTINSFFNLLETSFSVSEFVGLDFSNLPSFLQPFGDTIQQLIKLRDINQKSKGNKFTTWIVDPTNPDFNGLGPGVGVIELNQVESFSTVVSLNTGGGGATLNIQDPYKTMVISEIDIEIALRDALSPTQQLDQVAGDFLKRAELLDVRLNESRRKGDSSEVNFSFPLGRENPIGTMVETGISFDRSTLQTVGFSNVQAALVTEILLLLKEWHTSLSRAVIAFADINEKYSDVRKRMRSEYLGFSIIQQMDALHIFMNSNTRDISGVNDISTLGDILNVNNDTLSLSTIEKEHKFTAPDVPWPMYLAMRDRSVFRGDGVQIFSGLVENVKTSYRASDGSFTMRVVCKDNVKYLDLGRFTKNPALENPSAILYDPLTPFQSTIDPGTGLRKGDFELSDENKKRLKYLHFDDGILSGQRVTEQNIFQEKLVGGKVLSFQHVPGLIYKWKEGIISESLATSTQRNLSGIGPVTADVTSTFGVTSLENPFGGLDAADSISILITGRPFNYATFFKHAIDSGVFSTSNTNQSQGYFNYLFDFLERQNQAFGDFFPAISSPIDPIVAGEAYKQKRKFDSFNRDLLLREQELAELEDKIGSSSGALSSNLISGDSEDKALIAIRTNIKQVRQRIADIKKASLEGTSVDDENLSAVSFGVVGNNSYLSFDNTQLQEARDEIEWNVIRKPEEVRFNTDKNYFIVSEEYTSNTDIQAFAKNLARASPDIWNSDYENPKDLCMQAAESIGFELYANSQGNIVFKPPSYNRTPLSLLFRLIALQKGSGVSHAPEFLESLFQTREKLLLDDIKITELEILKNLVLLGEQISSNTGGSFSFPSEIGTKSIGIDLMSFSLTGTSSGNTLSFEIDEEVLRREATKDSIFDIGQQSALRGRGLDLSDSEFTSAAFLLISVENAILEFFGRFDLKSTLSDSDDLAQAKKDILENIVGRDTNAQTNRLQLIKQMAQKVSTRQSLLKQWIATKKNRVSFDPLEKSEALFGAENIRNISDFANTLGSTTSGLSTFPKFMENLIEDDLSNKKGFRSGKRFIIEDDVILGMDIDANEPEFNFIEVVGNEDLLRTSSDGGLGGIKYQFWAGSVDFDSWRKYGFRPGPTIHRADFTDAETQCAPYGVFKLQEQRRKLHSGTVTVIGNEFYEVGDVVYITNKSSLFYVEEVSHTHDLKSNEFSTTLNISFGRALGEYIPTTLDIIGRGVLSNSRKSVGRVKANRTNVPSQHVTYQGTLFLDNWELLNITNISKARSGFVSNETNKNTIANIVTKARTKVTSNNNFKIEIRSYYLKPSSLGEGSSLSVLDKIKQGISKIPNIFKTSEETKAREQAQASFERSELIGSWTKSMILDLSLNADDSSNNSSSIPSNRVTQVSPLNIDPEVKLTDSNKFFKRFPSQQAWAGKNTVVAARDGLGLPLNAVDVFFVIDEKSDEEDHGFVAEFE